MKKLLILPILCASLLGISCPAHALKETEFAKALIELSLKHSFRVQISYSVSITTKIALKKILPNSNDTMKYLSDKDRSEYRETLLKLSRFLFYNMEILPQAIKEDQPNSMVLKLVISECEQDDDGAIKDFECSSPYTSSRSEIIDGPRCIDLICLMMKYIGYMSPCVAL